MTKGEILTEVTQILMDQLGIEEDEVWLDSHIIIDLGADSLDIIELLVAVEEVFELEISDEETRELTTVQGVVDYIAQHAK
jgi:acyl carrier protein